MQKAKTIVPNSTTQPAKQLQKYRYPLYQFEGKEVFVSLKKSDHFSTAKKQNPLETSMSPPPKGNINDKKTIEGTIKQLLKDKKDLLDYLQSEKQFIQMIDVHNDELQHLVRNRGKLASSLTEKKKSRIDTYVSNKNNSVSDFCRVSKGIQVQNTLTKQALTVEVFKKNKLLIQNNYFAQVQSRQYQTISFGQLGSKKGERYQKHNQNLQNIKLLGHQNIAEVHEQDYSQKCLLISSPKKKKKSNPKQRLHIDQKNTFYVTKYGLTNFSPWAFPKNDPDLDLGENSSVLIDERTDYQRVFKEKVMNFDVKTKSKHKTVQKNIQPKGKQNTKTKELNSIKNSDKTYQTNKSSPQQNYAQKETISAGCKNIIQSKQIQSVQSQKKEAIFGKENYLSLQTKKTENEKTLAKPPVKLIKSSQVVILQSCHSNGSEIFASKQQAKQIFHPRKSLKNKLNFINNTKNTVKEQLKVFETQIQSEYQKFSYPCLKQVNQNNQKQPVLDQYHIAQQSELIELKKTQQFLKQIILNKNSISYANSRSVSKKELKQINRPICEHEDRPKQKIFQTKNILASGTLLENQSQKSQSSIEQQWTRAKVKSSFNKNSDHQTKKNMKQEYQHIISADKKKVMSSLDYNLYDNEVIDIKSGPNSKCLTEASLNGFYLISQSKIKNARNSFVRRKRHSLLNKRKRQEAKDDQVDRKFSQSVDRQVLNGSRNQLSFLSESKGFRVVNPLTKKLYNKYVSIVQNKRS